MRRDKTRQIPHSKLPRPISDVLTQSSNVRCRQTQPVVLDAASGLDTVHCSSTKQAGASSSSSARALCGIGIAAYAATFLVDIFHLSLSRLYLASLEKASPIQTWPAGRLLSRELEDTLQTRMGNMNEMIPDQRCSIWFSNKAEPGTSIRGAFEFLGGGHKSRCVCVVCVCVCVCVCDLWSRAVADARLSYVHCFIDFTFAFEIDHVQQGGERMESRGHSNLFVVCNKAHHKINLLNAE